MTHSRGSFSSLSYRSEEWDLKCSTALVMKTFRIITAWRSKKPAMISVKTAIGSYFVILFVSGSFIIR
jgi:hypothetical protein